MFKALFVCMQKRYEIGGPKKSMKSQIQQYKKKQINIELKEAK